MLNPETRETIEKICDGYNVKYKYFSKQDFYEIYCTTQIGVIVWKLYATRAKINCTIEITLKPEQDPILRIS